MADVSAPAPVFSRGSTVLDYWLIHAEGMTIQPLGARVEEVVAPSFGQAEALIVRSRMTHRRKAIPAASIVAVEPQAGHLLLDASASGGGLRIPRPSPDRLAAARAGAAKGGRVVRAQAVGAARSTQAGTRSAFLWLQSCAVRACRTTAQHSRSAAAGAAMGIAWLAPRAARAGRTTARRSRSAAARTAMGVAWLAPRVAAILRTACATGARLTVAAAVIVARGAARTARKLERTATAAAERGRASLEARRAEQQRTLDE